MSGPKAAGDPSGSSGLRSSPQGVEFERLEPEEGLPDIFLETDSCPGFLQVRLRRWPSERLVVRTAGWVDRGVGV